MIKANKQLEKESNFNLIVIIFILLIFFVLISCKDPIKEDLKDGRCDTYGGAWYHFYTSSFDNIADYHYKCNICKKEVKTRIWYNMIKEQ